MAVAAEPAMHLSLMHLSPADLHVTELLPNSRAIQQEEQKGSLDSEDGLSNPCFTSETLSKPKSHDPLIPKSMTRGEKRNQRHTVKAQVLAMQMLCSTL